jgi:hypothetical protein
VGTCTSNVTVMEALGSCIFLFIYWSNIAQTLVNAAPVQLRSESEACKCCVTTCSTAEQHCSMSCIVCEPHLKETCDTLQQYSPLHLAVQSTAVQSSPLHLAVQSTAVQSSPLHLAVQSTASTVQSTASGKVIVAPGVKGTAFIQHRCLLTHICCSMHAAS